MRLRTSFSVLYNNDVLRIGVSMFKKFNQRAIHVYEKIGFIREGIRRQGCFFNNKYYDMITMSILKDEFREKYNINILFKKAD